MKINFANWKNYKIGDLFDIHPTKAYNAINVQLFDDGEVPVIVNSSFNNGVGGFTSRNSSEKAGTVTFSDTTTAESIFYQPKDFVGYPHIQGCYPVGSYSKKWNEKTLLFFVSVFRAKALSEEFDYVNKFTREAALKLIIKLPSQEKHGVFEPDWEYMERFIDETKIKCIDQINKLSNLNENHKKISLITWRSFNLYDEQLFEIDSGTKLDKVQMKNDNPSINFVGRSSVNNGVTTTVDRIEGLVPYSSGYLTLALGGELGSCFVQKEEFYTSQNVVVLIPKKQISYYAKQFIASVIFRESRLHYKAFVDELNRHIKTDFTIKLPVDENGDIDFDYMNDFILEIENKTKKEILVLMHD